MNARLPGGRAVAGGAVLMPLDALAHSFGSTPYVLPIPLWIYAYGCVATLIVTFAMMPIFARPPAARISAPAKNASDARAGYTMPRGVVTSLCAAAAGCLLLTILAGFIGTTDPARNLGMTLFWVLFLLGFPWLTLLIGDLYSLVNPWKVIVAGIERIGFNLSTPRWPYPERLGYWPALIFYVALIWMELFAAPRPRLLSCVLLLYTAATIAGVALFGKLAWFGKADAFGVLFRLVGALAPVEYDRAPEDVRWKIRRPFTGSLHQRPEHPSLVLFILFMLASTTYDALHETTLWIGLYWRNALFLSQPLWGDDFGKAQGLLMDGYLFYRQAGLLALPLLYFGIYLLALLGAKALTRTPVSARTLALAFAYSLLPIAIAYHFTHYFTWFIEQVRALPALIADPFGFGSAPTREPAGAPVLSMAFVWHAQVAALLAGHLISIYLAHRSALQTFQAQSPSVIGQLPLLLLMIVYTIVGLWILSLPLSPG